MIAMSVTLKRVLRSTLFATALVAILTVLAILPYLGFFAYTLVPGIDISGLIFSSGIESYHLLRFEVAAVFLNIVIYAGCFYFVLAEPRIRQRRTYSEYYTGSRSTSSLHGPSTDGPSLRESPVVSGQNSPLATTEDE